MSDRKGWRGYVSSRAIDGNIIPQRVQNLVIRTYAKNRGMLYLLSATEYYMYGCYMMLRATVAELQDLRGIIFYSMGQLPEAPDLRREIYDQVLHQGGELHFALEELRVADEQDIQLIEDTITCKHLAATSEATAAALKGFEGFVGGRSPQPQEPT
ncbi:hypothetical protein HC928_08795 [bacterium]|nr:hypothetical protein [bacterium]